MVRGIKFVGIPVRDQDVALNFYTNALGLKVATDQPFNDKQRWIELLIPGAEIDNERISIRRARESWRTRGARSGSSAELKPRAADCRQS